MWKTDQDPVVFVDRSSDFTVPANNRKRVRSSSLPDPEFIRIHAAITGILNMSGAGKFFHELLDKYRLRQALQRMESGTGHPSFVFAHSC